MYDGIVVPLDGSRLAEVALPFAEELAGRMNSDISLLTVLESADVAEHRKHLTYAKKIASMTKYHAAKYTGNGNGNPIKVDIVTRTGSPAESIIDYTTKGGFKLIIMASHGRSGISHWAVGSVADKVIRSTSWQPVMLIRAKESRSDIREKRILRKALVPLDGSTESESVMPYIETIASKLEMELTLFQVIPQNDNNHEAAEAYLEAKCAELEYKGITANYQLRIGSIADLIIDSADELAFDLVAMSTHGRAGVSLWTMGSVAQKVFLGGNTPLLLVKQ